MKFYTTSKGFLLSISVWLGVRLTEQNDWRHLLQEKYALTKEFTLRLLSLVLSDDGFGMRVVEALEPELIPYRSVSLLFSVLKRFTEQEGEFPKAVTCRQLLRSRYHDGVVTEEVYKEALFVHRQSQLLEPVSRAEATIVLEEILLDVELLSALDDAYKLHKDRKYQEIFARLDTAQDRVRLLARGDMGCNMRKDLSRYLDRIEKGEAKVDRIPMGIAELDANIKGGLGRTELGCILGAEKDGKSMALSHIAASDVLLGKIVVYITAELSQLTVENRVTANLTGIHLDDLETGGVAITREVGTRLSNIFEATGGNIFYKHFPPGTATVRDIEAYLRDIRRFWGAVPDVVIVDYADELADTRKAKNVDSGSTYLALGNIYTDLKALGDETRFNCAVWTASQVQRGAIGKQVIEFRDVADSILKVAKVDLMLSLCRDEEERSVDLLRIYVAACRFAPFPSEVGPFTRDYEHGRLITFGETARRFDQETEIWLRAKLSEARISHAAMARVRNLELARQAKSHLQLVHPLADGMGTFWSQAQSGAFAIQ